MVRHIIIDGLQAQTLMIYLDGFGQGLRLLFTVVLLNVSVAGSEGCYRKFQFTVRIRNSSSRVRQAQQYEQNNGAHGCPIDAQPTSWKGL